MSDRCCWCAMLLLPLVTRLLPSSSWSSGLHVEAIVQACLEGPTSALPTEAKGPIVLERGGAENLGLPVDGLTRLTLEHNGTAPRRVSKSFAEWMRAGRGPRRRHAG